ELDTQVQQKKAADEARMRAEQAAADARLRAQEETAERARQEQAEEKVRRQDCPYVVDRSLPRCENFYSDYPDPVCFKYETFCTRRRY
ncbi:hypothetical protein, partial [Bradyrhizobium sp. Rc2d]|uniref:hypothetical protein n=1 Tax=Bradyrhizobium sp. Rc2d TaxID=1855321 RepID=UPI001AEC9B5C